MTPAAALRLATRGSRLALAQTRIVVEALEALGIRAETIVITTRGDAAASSPEQSMEGQGWFTTELERALVEGRADAAVHSAKDLPTELAPGLEVGALLSRGDPRDAAVTRDGRSLAELELGGTVGTSSPRRVALLGSDFPGLRVLPLRGNVDTRLDKLDRGDVDALVLAAAGLDRLGLGGRIAERLDPRRFVPAPAQGALAVEVRAGSTAADAVAPLHDGVTAAAVAAERSVLTHLGGGCLLPLGAWGRVEGGRLVVTAALVDGAGRRDVELDGGVDDPAALGAAVASRLR